MKEIIAYRQSIRKDTNAIKELLDGHTATLESAVIDFIYQYFFLPAHIEMVCQYT
jgi:hypothetical protein